MRVFVVMLLTSVFFLTGCEDKKPVKPAAKKSELELRVEAHNKASCKCLKKDHDCSLAELEGHLVESQKISEKLEELAKTDQAKAAQLERKMEKSSKKCRGY